MQTTVNATLGPAQTVNSIAAGSAVEIIAVINPVPSVATSDGAELFDFNTPPVEDELHIIDPVPVAEIVGSTSQVSRLRAFV